MFRERSPDQYEEQSSAGVRYLFRLGNFSFEDTIDEDGEFHHFIEEAAMNGEPASRYEVDRETMYEFAARYLAGLYELEKYRLRESPGHVELLDVLEIATARARSGESDFSWDEFDSADAELMEDDQGGGEEGDARHA
jgi:hypothetical protein